MRIYELVIEPGRVEHIARHQASVEEVEEVIFGEPFIRRARLERYYIIGQTEVCTAWSQPEMQMMLSAERFCETENRNTYDKTRTRGNKGL